MPQPPRDLLGSTRRTFVVSGAAGFIGSHLVEALLRLGQRVIGFDNFSTGHRRNLEEVLGVVGPEARNFTFLEGDIRDFRTCVEALGGADIVLHQAALGSVPRSIKDPVTTNDVNVGGFLNVLLAARDCGIRRVVYAGSSSSYGDDPNLPKVESRIGRPLSPYAVSKYADELYAGVFGDLYDLELIGLRYFNVFGPRQDPDGPYAAVIPKWIGSLLAGEPCFINGDGETSRDFCYVANVVQANLLAATVDDGAALGQVYNVAAGKRTTLNELFRSIRDQLAVHVPHVQDEQPVHREFREGDVRHSLADISKARDLLGYEPTYPIDEGLRETTEWFASRTPSSAGDSRSA